MRGNGNRVDEAYDVPIVVVDANAIVHRDWRLQSPWWRLLLELSAIGRIQLVVPEIVVREVVGSIRGPQRHFPRI